jgi:hypothetical protein
VRHTLTRTEGIEIALKTTPGRHRGALHRYDDGIALWHRENTLKVAMAVPIMLPGIVQLQSILVTGISSRWGGSGH